MEHHASPPPYSSPPRGGGTLPSATRREGTPTNGNDRPLPSTQSRHLHPAYIPHYNQRSLQNHVSFAPVTQASLPRLATNTAQPGVSHQIIQVTQLGDGTKVQNNPPVSFWLPSPQTPHTLDSRRSGLQSFPAPPRSPKKGQLSRSPFVDRIKRFILRFFVEWWMLEVLSWCFSAGCMVTIIVVLSQYNNKAMPHWPHWLTLNGFISIFSGFARAALLLPTAEALGQLKWNIFRNRPRTMLDFERLDMASRGPWGGLLLLLKTRRLSLSALGAAIVVMALPVDIFFQQIVHYPIGFTDQNPACTLPAATTYQPWDGQSVVNGTAAFRAPIALQTTPLQLFLSNNSIPQLKVSCPTSNCTWDPFDTLAVCSKCHDASSLLTYDCISAPADWLLGGSNKPGSIIPNMTQCGYFVKFSGKAPVLVSGYTMVNGSRGSALGTRFLPLYDPFTRRPYGDGSFFFKDVINPLHNTLIASTPDGPAGAYTNSTPQITECILYYCVQTIRSSFSLGGYTEDIIDKHPMITSNQTGWDYTPAPGTPSGQPSRYTASHSLTLPSRLKPGDVTIFTVDNTTTVESMIVFDPMSPSFVVMKQQDASPRLRWVNHLQVTPPTEQPYPNSDNPWLPSANITEQIALMAKAMSYGIRNAPRDTIGGNIIAGKSWSQETIVQIRWEWITLPLALLGISLVFLVATIVRSTLESEHVGIWKTSALAILFNGLGEDVQALVGPNCRMGEAKDKAREIMVRLAPD